MFEREGDDKQPKQYLGRHIVIATTVDAQRGVPLPHDIQMVVDMHAGATPLTGTQPHHQSYAIERRRRSDLNHDRSIFPPMPRNG